MDPERLISVLGDDRAFIPTVLKQDFTPLQYKVIFAYLAMSSRGEIVEFRPIEFRTGELAELAQLKNIKNLYWYLKNQASTMQMQLNIAPKGSFDLVPAFHTRKYNPKRRSFVVQTDPRLTYLYREEIDRLNGPQLFSDVFSLNDKYSIRFILALHLLLGDKPNAEIRFTVDQFRQLMLQEDTETKYKRFAHFNDRILQKVVKRVNTHTQLIVEAHQLPSGQRKVTGLAFVIRRKTDKDSKLLLISQAKQDPVTDLLIQHGVHPKTSYDRVQKLRSIQSDDESITAYIFEAIRYTKTKNLKSDNSFVPYLLKTIEMNYHGFDWEAFKRKHKSGIARTANQLNSKKVQIQETFKTWLHEYRLSSLTDWFSGLLDSHRSTLISEANKFLQEKGREHVMGELTLNNATSPTHASYFEDYLLGTNILSQSDLEPSDAAFQSFCLDRGYPIHELQSELAQLESRLKELPVAV